MVNFLILILILICFLVIFVLFKNIKNLNISCVFLINGAVKGGKTFLSVYSAILWYKRELFMYYIKCFLCFILRKEKPLKPMLYSNIHLRGIKYNLLTIYILQREVKIPPKSVVLMDEASLVADSMLYKDTDINEDIKLFVKLFGHYSKGGHLIINTQAIEDLHYNFKRCISKHLYIYKRIKLPFFTVMKVRELMYSSDNSNITNVIQGDLEDSLKTIIVPNKYYKYYDCYCYSIFTDDLPLYAIYDTEKKNKKDSLKTDIIPSFIDFKRLDKRKEEKKNETK